MSVPSNYKYAKTDEWVKVEGNVATIGISDYAQEQLSDIVYLEVEVDVDDNVEKDVQFATVESVKAASDIYAPMSGKVAEVNKNLDSSPEAVNKSPYEDGWIAVIEISSDAEKSNLMDGKKYSEYVKTLEDNE